MSMAAEIIRTEKTSWGGIKYVVKCQYCGGETTRYNKTGRNATCVKCSKKNDRERAEKRKLEREREIYNKAIEDVFIKIEKELSQSSSTEYVCMNGKNIHTDVGYVEDWFNEYRKVKAGVKNDD